MQEARRAAPFTLGDEHQGAQTRHEPGFRRDLAIAVHIGCDRRRSRAGSSRQ
jgi:hypothetical protein